MREAGAGVGDALRETTPLTLLCFDGKEYYAAGAPMPTVGWAVVSVVEKELTELPERQMLEEYDRINEAASARFRRARRRLPGSASR